MKTLHLILLFCSLMLAGLGAVIFIGLKPKAVPQIDLSSFSNFTEFNATLVQKLTVPLKENSILFIGYQPEKTGQYKLAMELVELLEKQEPKLKHLFVDKYLKWDLPGFTAVDSKQEWQNLLATLKTILGNQEKALVVLPALYSSHLISGNLVRLIQEELKTPILALTVAELLRSREEEKSSLFPCIVTGDTTGAGDFGCALLQSARANYRHKLPAEKWAGLVEQRGETDFLILLSNR